MRVISIFRRAAGDAGRGRMLRIVICTGRLGEFYRCIFLPAIKGSRPEIEFILFVAVIYNSDIHVAIIFNCKVSPAFLYRYISGKPGP